MRPSVFILSIIEGSLIVQRQKLARYPSLVYLGLFELSQPSFYCEYGRKQCWFWIFLILRFPIFGFFDGSVIIIVERRSL
jgi:hypothetical protein